MRNKSLIGFRKANLLHLERNSLKSFICWATANPKLINMHRKSSPTDVEPISMVNHVMTLR